MMNEGATDEIVRQTWELKKERIKLSDERTELNRLLRVSARRDAFMEQVREIIREVPPSEFLLPVDQVSSSDTDLAVQLTDLHTGINVDNYFNKFNYEILKERCSKFLEKIIETKIRHNAQDCHLIVGEIISGLIHPDLRVQSNENILEQFRLASNLVSDFVAFLSRYFNSVHVYVTPGNHSRITANKSDAIRGENMDLFLPDFLEAKLQNYKNVIINYNTIDPYIAVFKIRNELCMAAHGDKDSPNTVVKSFTSLFGAKPSIVFLGHKHHNAFLSDDKVKVVQGGCMSGSDDHTIDIRKHSDPEQTISVISDKGYECFYPVNLSREKGDFEK